MSGKLVTRESILSNLTNEEKKIYLNVERNLLSEIKNKEYPLFLFHKKKDI